MTLHLLPTKAGIAHLRRGETLHSVVKAIADDHGLTVEDLRGPGRSRKFCGPRHDAMLALRRSFGLSLYGIGVFFGGRDHTTVRNGLMRAEELEAQGIWNK